MGGTHLCRFLSFLPDFTRFISRVVLCFACQSAFYFVQRCIAFGFVLCFCCLPDISVESLHPAWFAFLQAHVCFILKFAHLSLFYQDILVSFLFLLCLLVFIAKFIFMLF